MASPFRIPVADLLHHVGSSRAVELSAPLAGLNNEATEVPASDPIAVDVTLERIPEGFVVRGTLRAPWKALCSRCLEPMTGEVAVHVDELYEADPLEGETYLLEADVLDLEPMARDALLLELPSVPVCAETCAGLCPSCGINRNHADCDCTTDDTDPRWAALKSLEL